VNSSGWGEGKGETALDGEAVREHSGLGGGKG
jgi:hypothetical protein